MIWLGRVESECARCDRTIDVNWWQNIRHDLECWGLRTALLNLWARLTWSEAAWGGYCDDCGRPHGS